MNKALLILIFSILYFQIYSQNNEDLSSESKEYYDKISKMNKEEFNAFFREQHSRIPKEIKNILDSKAKSSVYTMPRKLKKNNHISSRASILPSDARFPGEFDEMQGIIISWPYYSPNPNNPNIIIIDTVRNQSNADIWKTIARGVQLAGAKIYINVNKASDTNAILKYMVDKGYPLENYKFMIKVGDAFWARDYGPVCFYYENDSKIGWVDFKYYPGRNRDDAMNVFWTTQIANHKVYKSKLNYEGGNVILNGSDDNELLTSQMVLDLNRIENGLSVENTTDSLFSYFNTSNVHVLPYMEYEGGTGHIDLYLQRTHDFGLVHSFYPIEMEFLPKKVGEDTIWNDYKISSNNINYLTNDLKSGMDQKSNIVGKIPLPKKDDNSWYLSGEDYNNFTRTYSNALIVNDVIVLPNFHDETSGDKNWDTKAIAEVQKLFPGYKIIPADMRSLDGSGGSIHCVTKEIPAENPVRIYNHYPYHDIENYQSKYPVNAKIKNQSGISEAKVYYRYKRQSQWKTATMIESNQNDYSGDILPTLAGNDTIEYYIEATSNNGKTMQKPISAPQGYFTFYTKKNANSKLINSNIDICMYPNPTSDKLNIKIEKSISNPILITIINSEGKSIENLELKPSIYEYSIDTRNYSRGVYYLEYFVNGQRDVRKFIVK